VLSYPKESCIDNTTTQTNKNSFIMAAPLHKYLYWTSTAAAMAD